uniref:Uncharacterized protein n=1 Tax=Opuntia streptacantha TaxID=393608 RepID=A0A7C9EGT2_OPUST
MERAALPLTPFKPPPIQHIQTILINYDSFDIPIKLRELCLGQRLQPCTATTSATTNHRDSTAAASAMTPLLPLLGVLGEEEEDCRSQHQRASCSCPNRCDY